MEIGWANSAPWLGFLYVLVEGWQDLGLSDEKIGKLLTSPHVQALKRFRNGVYHFQRTYFDDRFLGMFQENGPEWASELYIEFGRFFKDWLSSRGFDSTFETNEKGEDIAIVTHPTKAT